MPEKRDVDAETYVLMTRLDNLTTQITDTLGHDLTKWYRERADEYAAHEPPGIPLYRVENLKKEVEAAANGMLEQVRIALSAPHLWPHRTGQDLAILGRCRSGELPEAFLAVLEPITSDPLSNSFGTRGYNVPHSPVHPSPAISLLLEQYLSGTRDLRSLHSSEDAAEKQKSQDAVDRWRKL
jgi:hypothetical protein